MQIRKDRIKYYQEKNGLNIREFVQMSNHIQSTIISSKALKKANMEN